MEHDSARASKMKSDEDAAHFPANTDKIAQEILFKQESVFVGGSITHTHDVRSKWNPI